MIQQKILSGILTPCQLEYGFAIREEVDDFVYLYLGKDCVAAFNQMTTAEEIHKVVVAQIKNIIAYRTTDHFAMMAEEYARDQGWKEPA